MELEFMNTPMSDTQGIKNCQYCKGKKEKYICTLVQPRKQLYWLYPCCYLQELICPRVLKVKYRA